MSKAHFETFVSAVASKNASAVDIESWIEKWHQDQICTLDLPAFLGFTENEYAKWIENANALQEILANHSK